MFTAFFVLAQVSKKIKIGHDLPDAEKKLVTTES